MNNPEIKKFIQEHSHLFWYIPENKKEGISEGLLLETIMNYGTLDDNLRLFALMGKNRALNLLKGIKGRKKGNIYPELFNFFTLYLSRNA